MYEFLMKLLHLALPRVRDFGVYLEKHLIKGKLQFRYYRSFNISWNWSTKTSKNKGMNITIVTTATKDEGTFPFENWGPFKKK